MSYTYYKRQRLLRRALRKLDFVKLIYDDLLINNSYCCDEAIDIENYLIDNFDVTRLPPIGHCL